MLETDESFGPSITFFCLVLRPERRGSTEVCSCPQDPDFENGLRASVPAADDWWNAPGQKLQI